MNQRCTYLKKDKEFLPLKVHYFNAQCLSNKFAQLADYIAEHDPDVLAVTETWFDDQVSDTEFVPADYSCFRRDRNISDYALGTYENKARGGVLFLIKKDLNPTPYSSGDTSAEILWVEIKPHSKVSWLLGVCYRPKSTSKL